VHTHTAARLAGGCSEAVRVGRSEAVRQAQSPSVALCVRAVYAAFLWHERIVHDAMASASFLKFHPKLPKELPVNLRTRRRQASLAEQPPDTNDRCLHRCFVWKYDQSL